MSIKYHQTIETNIQNYKENLSLYDESRELL